MGELIAWIIGWDLILEYAVSNMAVSVGFAAHLVGMFDWFGWHPALRWISPAYLPGGLSDLKGNVLYTPGLHFGFDIPAFLIVMILTVVLVRGIRESSEANNTMVILKIAAILAFVIAGAHFVNPGNWHPFAPQGWSGILTGGSIIFFTYIGFDSVSTAAEEAKNPQRDLPIGIIATLVVCTVVYISVATASVCFDSREFSPDQGRNTMRGLSSDALQSTSTSQDSALSRRSPHSRRKVISCCRDCRRTRCVLFVSFAIRCRSIPPTFPTLFENRPCGPCDR
jgi:amino acid transporter